ncbi:ribosome recycling factor [Thiohalophilus thiocyanatoxydans]|uniref:Ribosome-recycling factor n=1 Tax=Thiohalophilus thiocyanatoxydans TaxID=381308 RepID=A0A4R8IHM5_9GAMM|nr:ribosome recycling factor [Thiohalophilus thiocyanatoxydans]TDY00116.1 ribosome recycling factor [Thiohalophilus thiocyanatoxydans]
MINDIKKDAESRMGKSVEALKTELTKLRTGRAHTSLLDHVMVEYYGSQVPLNQVASISVGDARTLTVQPWEKPMVQKVEKAILESDLGLNPATSGEVIRVPLPALTEERRKDMIRIVRQEGENTRVAIRNIRRDAISDFKSLLKDKEITEDEEHKAEEEIQKLTDKYIAKVDEALEAKEKDLMEI